MYRFLISLHVVSGAVALLGAAGALVTKKGERSHIWSGRTFAAAMAVALVTAVPMSIVGANVFLLLITLFSSYLVYSGWTRARNRTGSYSAAERFAAGAMIVTALAMFAWGIRLYLGGDGLGIALVVFAVIGGGLAAGDVRALRGNHYRGAARIEAHLTRMLAGAIAALTAFAVVNVRIEPAVLVWLTPTAALTPAIAYWSYRVRTRG